MNRTELRNALMASGWSADAIKLAEKTGFRCEYCGKDFFHSVDDYYSFEVEHIIPRGQFEEKPENLTTVCSTCNFFKRRWDPSVASDASTREELIAAARKYVTDQRKQKEEKISRERELAKRYLAASD